MHRHGPEADSEEWFYDEFCRFREMTKDESDDSMVKKVIDFFGNRNYPSSYNAMQENKSSDRFFEGIRSLILYLLQTCDAPIIANAIEDFWQGEKYRSVLERYSLPQSLVSALYLYVTETSN